MDKELRNILLALFTCGLLIIGIIAFGFWYSETYYPIAKAKKTQIESDICYSLKMNRILLKGYEAIYEDHNINKQPIYAAYKEIEKMEDRNWMGCEESSDALGRLSE